MLYVVARCKVAILNQLSFNINLLKFFLFYFLYFHLLSSSFIFFYLLYFTFFFFTFFFFTFFFFYCIATAILQQCNSIVPKGCPEVVCFFTGCFILFSKKIFFTTFFDKITFFIKTKNCEHKYSIPDKLKSTLILHSTTY